jgi:N-acetylneuraminic acid mutarotase
MTGGSEPSGDGICQGIYNFQELDGTVHTLAFANADMYEYNWGTNQWAMTDLSTKGVSVSAAAKLSFANSRGKLIVTDGVNTPWMWDGATTYTLLTEAPIANMVCVYYDRVFFFDATATNIKFEWSFPADPTHR